MVARKDPADEPFFREWNACRGALTPDGRPMKRSKARSAQFRDLLFADLAPAHPSDPGADARLPLPVPALLVVGSKGKGTSVAAASFALRELGYTVGTVSSPPLRWDGERIRIDGRTITPAEYARASALAADTLARMPRLGAPAPDGTVGYLPPSGLYTQVAIRYLLDRGVDALVVEEGLGGASDDVSLFDFPVVALTQVFGEHLDVLGGSLDAVAADLLGVVSPATHTVLSFPDQPAEARTRLAALNTADAPRAHYIDAVPMEDAAPPVAAGAQSAVAAGRAPVPPTTDLTGTNIRLGVAAAITLTGLRRGYDDIVAEARTRLNLPARLSRHEHAGLTWLVDAAINPAGVRAALAGARAELGGDPVVIAGFPDTKDVDACIAELASLPDANIVLAGAGTDYLSYAAARRYADRFGPVAEVPAALARAVELARGRDSGAAGGPAAVRSTAGILTVGTMSFAGMVLEALDADVSAWW
ncbi:hypothetical protein [Brevibacterium moorei]|uniref:hypothetical protein n=1 Tax=Brevibacterium moorei TaxID=2968457 RepID=UPI00211CE6EE|nr:hypothetical protein [Brevibacterium sp. 68QC2CO]MCQ9386772.1 hypothetical protein [Brevibacterium sp. 68QC2CO]